MTKGNASLSGKAGTVKFSVSEEIKEYGLSFRYASVMFSGNRDGVMVYKASVGIGAEIIVSGVLDVEKLILNCSVTKEKGSCGSLFRSPLNYQQVRSKRSRFITLFHAATKSLTNFSCESAAA